MNMDSFQMKKGHQELLRHNRLYLLHNLRPTEEFWAALAEKGVFSSAMLEDIRSYDTNSQRVSHMLDLLPARGPDAFDLFCDILLEFDHQHVAEYLITLESTDQFKTDIYKLCHKESTENKGHVDKIVDMFKRSIPRVQRFLERKFDLDLKEQDNVFQEKENELTEMEENIREMQSKYLTMRGFLKKILERSEALSSEVSRDYISRSLLREEKKFIEELSLPGKDTDFQEIAERMGKSFTILVNYLETTAASKVNQRKSASHETGGTGAMFGRKSIPVTLRVQKTCDGIRGLIDVISTRNTVSCDMLRHQLDTMLSRLHEVIEDMFYVREVFVSNLQRKEELTDETLSLIHNYKEVQRLEQEMTEKRKHVNELRHHGASVKKKSKKHQRQLEQIKQSIDEQKEQMGKIERAMQRQMNSADQRIHFIMSILPDRDGNANVGQLVRTCTRCSSMLSSWSDAEVVDLDNLSRSSTSMTVMREHSDLDTVTESPTPLSPLKQSKLQSPQAKTIVTSEVYEKGDRDIRQEQNRQKDVQCRNKTGEKKKDRKVRIVEPKKENGVELKKAVQENTVKHSEKPAANKQSEKPIIETKTEKGKKQDVEQERTPRKPNPVNTPRKQNESKPEEEKEPKSKTSKSASNMSKKPNKTSVINKSIINKKEEVPLSTEASASDGTNDQELQQQIIAKIQENHEKAMKIMSGTPLPSEKVSTAVTHSTKDVNTTRNGMLKGSKSIGVRALNKSKSFTVNRDDGLNDLSKLLDKSLTDTSLTTSALSKPDTLLNIKESQIEKIFSRNGNAVINGMEKSNPNKSRKTSENLKSPRKEMLQLEKPKIVVHKTASEYGETESDVLNVGALTNVLSKQKADPFEPPRFWRAKESNTSPRNLRYHNSIPSSAHVRQSSLALGTAESGPLKMTKINTSATSPRVQRSNSTPDDIVQNSRQILNAKKVKLGDSMYSSADR